MKNIFFAAAIIFLFSCNKNVESRNGNNVNKITGQWASTYMGSPFQVTIAENKKFSMELPVMVKKESGSKPETLVCRLSGVCVQQEGWYELQTDQFSILHEAGSGGSANAILQSLAGVDLVIERADSGPLSFRISSGSMIK